LGKKILLTILSISATFILVSIVFFFIGFILQENVDTATQGGTLTAILYILYVVFFGLFIWMIWFRKKK